MSNEIVKSGPKPPSHGCARNQRAHPSGTSTRQRHQAARGQASPGDLARMRRAARRRRWFVLADWPEHQSWARDPPATPIILQKDVCPLEPDQEPRHQSAAWRSPATASIGTSPTRLSRSTFPNNRTPYKWTTKRTVAESGLDKFGSSQPENPRSTPAASMTYQMLWAFRLPDGRPQLGVITNSRTGIKPMKELFGMIDGKGVDHFFQRFRIRRCAFSVRPGEYFFGYKYFAVDNWPT